MAFSLSGTIEGLSIRQSVVAQAFFAEQAQAVTRLEGIVKQAGAIKQISVNLLPDASHARLQHVKDITNAAGAVGAEKRPQRHLARRAAPPAPDGGCGTAPASAGRRPGAQVASRNPSRGRISATRSSTPRETN